MRTIVLFILIISFFSFPAFCQSKKEQKLKLKIEKKMKGFSSYFEQFKDLSEFKLDSLSADPESKNIQLFLNKGISFIPLREHHISNQKIAIKNHLGRSYRKYNLELFSGKTPLNDLVPNYFRSQLKIDSSHFAAKKEQKVLYQRMSEDSFPLGLMNKHIALWHSHGRYYESKLDRWEWQRARLHGTVEDILPLSFVIPYLSVMLENAGAITLIPRERDIQKNEIIIDNDKSTGKSKFIPNMDLFQFSKKEGGGFLWKEIYIENENPFHLGSCLNARAKFFPSTDSIPMHVATYVPEIPAKDSYAVYISYGKQSTNLSKVLYRIHSLNGTQEFLVDQSMSATTWVYLGHFDFPEGIEASSASVEVYSYDAASIVSLDAIKIGGGMGNIARRPGQITKENKWSLKGQKRHNKENTTSKKVDPEDFEWKISTYPRYMEAARYFLQYSGMPDSIVYSLSGGSNDYNDDYQSRGEWVNYLMGKPNGPSDHRLIEGLNIPVDLSFAFHTDAGVSPNDSLVGTLGIYSSESDEGFFPGGQSKMVSRELTDIIQSQIVSDIRKLYNEKWTRRGIWDKAYSEAYRANVPTMLLELLSHQNLADMQYAWDPRFRFSVSRAIYKGMLKFLSFQEKRSLQVQPLPIDHFSIHRIGEKRVVLTWKAVQDPLEASALPDYYKIYIRKNDGAFSELINRCDSLYFEFELPEFGSIYSFKIVAVNEGGKSFPSEILAVGFPSSGKNTALVINAFDRICAPAIVDTDHFAGLALWEDEGVPYQKEISFVGKPYDFDRNSSWLDDDSPGWGASDADQEGRIIPGNTFDYPWVHGQALMSNGIGFISMSDEAFLKLDSVPHDIQMVDLIFGEEKSTSLFRDQKEFRVFEPKMMSRIKDCRNSGISLFISGAYIGTDFIHEQDTIAESFARDILHYQWRSNHADRMGLVYGTESNQDHWIGNWTYNSGYHPLHYKVEAPDALEAAGMNAQCILRYKRSKASAGVAYSGDDFRTVSLGFPFETVLSEKGRNELMGKIIQFLIPDG